MKLPSLPIHPLPPRLTMDEYADFVSETLRHTSPDSIERQKRIEKRIAMPFRIPEDFPAVSPSRNPGGRGTRGTDSFCDGHAPSAGNWPQPAFDAGGNECVCGFVGMWTNAYEPIGVFEGVRPSSP